MAVFAFFTCEKENDNEDDGYVTITFDINGGKGTAPDPIKNYRGKGVVLPEGNDITNPPFAFEKWNTKPDGSGTDYSGDSYINLENDLKLFAVWSLPTVTFSLTGNYGTTPDPQTVEVGTIIKLPIQGDISRAGYKFAGWGKSRSTVVYSPGSDYKVDGHVTLYSSWVRVYTVTYAAGGGTGVPPASHEVEYGESIMLRYNTFTYSGLRFLGWYSPFINVQGGSSVISPGSIVIVYGNITFTARWGI